jgi:two-component system, NarL family, nitrate/nitrite response regulator NarL
MSELAGFSVLLVDDHPLFREGLMLALRQHEPQMLLHAVGSLDEALVHLQMQSRRGQQTDLVLLDYRLPGEDGLQCALRLRQRFPAVACAIMSGADDARLPARVREAGLMGYFPKTLDVSALLHGLQQLALGHSHFAPLHVPALQDASDPLTPRQREVLGMVARGATNKEIAQILQIAPHTVKNHLGQIFERLGAANRAQAVSMVQDSTQPGSLPL